VHFGKLKATLSVPQSMYSSVLGDKWRFEDTNLRWLLVCSNNAIATAGLKCHCILNCHIYGSYVKTISNNLSTYIRITMRAE